GSDPLLSLNQIQLFRTANASLLGATASGGSSNKPDVLSFASGATEVFRLNNSVTSFSEIKLDFSLNSGSGSGDMFLYVRDSAFSAGSGQYVVLYSQFGSPPGANNANDGYEEWAVRNDGSGGGIQETAPEPSTLVLALFGVGGLGLKGLRRLRRRGDAPAS